MQKSKTFRAITTIVLVCVLVVIIALSYIGAYFAINSTNNTPSASSGTSNFLECTGTAYTVIVETYSNSTQGLPTTITQTNVGAFSTTANQSEREGNLTSITIYNSPNQHTAAICVFTSYNANIGKYVYQSNVINSANPCNWGNASQTTLVANIRNYPNFTSLEGNRNYTYGGYGCTAGIGSGQSILLFDSYDYTHPFKVTNPCGYTSTVYPDYRITVTLNLTLTGYDLAHSTYDVTYYGADNTTVMLCTTTTG
jgi:hypothetical protein